MARARARQSSPTAGDNVVDLYDYLPKTKLRARPIRRRKLHDWHPTVIDDWPDRIPITEAELDVIEAHFGKLLDELFGPIH